MRAVEAAEHAASNTPWDSGALDTSEQQTPWAHSAASLPVSFMPEPSKQYSFTIDSQNCFRARVGLSGAKKHLLSNGMWGCSLSFFPFHLLLIHHTELWYRTQDQKVQPERKLKGIAPFLFLTVRYFSLFTDNSLFFLTRLPLSGL